MITMMVPEMEWNGIKHVGFKINCFFEFHTSVCKITYKAHGIHYYTQTLPPNLGTEYIL